MILAYKIGYKDWVYLVPMMQSNLNHTPVPSLGNKAPVELFTGLQCPTPLMEFYLPNNCELQEVPPSAEIDSYLDNLRNSLQEMHGAVQDRKLKQLLLNKKKEHMENLVNFAEGDYVLRSRVDEKHSNKLQVTWVGPYRVVRADSHSFRIEHLITGEQLDVHASRLKMYADDSLDVTEELLEHVASQGIILAVEELKDHRWNESIRDYEILVSWKGLQSIEDSYEPVRHLAKEIRVLVEKYIAKTDDNVLLEYWQSLQEDTTTTTAQPPIAQRPRTSRDAEGQVSSRNSNRKRRRSERADGDNESQENDNTSTQSSALSATRTRQVRRAPDENSQLHTSVESQVSQRSLGRRPRSKSSKLKTNLPSPGRRTRRSKRNQKPRKDHSQTV